MLDVDTTSSNPMPRSSLEPSHSSRHAWRSTSLTKGQCDVCGKARAPTRSARCSKLCSDRVGKRQIGTGQDRIAIGRFSAGNCGMELGERGRRNAKHLCRSFSTPHRLDTSSNTMSECS